MLVRCLTKPLSEQEIKEMYSINQANSPEVGNIPSIGQFKELTDLTETIYVFKDKEKIIGFILLMREDIN